MPLSRGSETLPFIAVHDGRCLQGPQTRDTAGAVSGVNGEEDL